MEAIIMKIDFSTLAFGYSLKSGGGTPNWATSLGQGKDYKINEDPSVNEILKGIIYSSVPLSKVKTKIGKGGRMVSGDAEDSPIILAALFTKVYCNDVLIPNGKYILLITRDTSESHSGRLRLKYGPSNTFESEDGAYTNQDFIQQAKQHLSLSDDACFFVSDIDVANQNELILKVVIVNAEGSVEYESTADLHSKWDILVPESETSKVAIVTSKLDEEWFAKNALKYPNLDEEAENLRKAFIKKYSPEKLSALSGIELLHNIFLNDQNSENLCRVLEFDPQIRDIFGSIKGGSAYKYGLFFASDGNWTGGTNHNPIKYTEEEAIVVGTKIRDHLVQGARAISEFGALSNIEDYQKLYNKLREITESDIDRAWVMKYFQMLYPQLFAPNYSDYAQRTILGAIGIEKEKYALVRMGQIKLFADKCGISNVVFNKVFWDNYVEATDTKPLPAESEITFKTGYQSDFPRNRILFGAPGTGKSYTLNKEKDELLGGNSDYERVTFHPDYSYANFVGTYKPVAIKDGEDENAKDAITYSYVPGPFMRTYVKALKNSRTDSPKPHLLVIEEINRANVAAVFGDVFQLLDRGDDEVSEYPIQASEDIRKYLAKELGGDPDSYFEIRIPDNMFIWATMNSADQGVFPMDTAFKRRWDFTYLGIDDSEAGIKGKKVVLGKGQDCRVVEWNNLRKAINSELLKYKVNEDKLMGPYFIAKKNLPEGQDIDASSFIRIFKNKVIMYLFDDAAKQKRQSLFAGCDEEERNQYSKICNAFEEKGVHIFCDNIADKFTIRPEDEAK